MARTHDDDDGSTRVGRTDATPSGTTAGADVTSRMSGSGRHADDDHPPTTGAAHTETAPVTSSATETEYESRVRPAKYKAAKTSAAATFALVFGLAALFCALTAILSLPAVVFAIIGIILGIVGMKKAKLPGVTGKGVAIGGLVTAVLGLLLGGAVLAGAAVFLNDEANLDRLQTEIDDLRENAPSTGELREEIPGG